MERIDVLVVGAGILGMASAYHILKSNPGKRVLVVDRYGAPGQGNTGRSNAMFRNTFSSRDNQVLSNASIDFYLHVQQVMKEDIGLQQIGYLWLMDKQHLSASGPFLKAMEENGVETRAVDRRELTEGLPGVVMNGDGGGQSSLLELPEIEAGVFGPKCGRLDPDKLVRFYARQFAEGGGMTSYSTQVEVLAMGPERRLGMEGEPFVWQDTEVESVSLQGRMNGPVKADKVVLACGAWGNELLNPIGLDGHVKTKKRQLFSIPTRGGDGLGPLLNTDIFNPLKLLPLVILPKSGVHFKPVREEGAFWVGCEDEVNRSYIDVPSHDLDDFQAEASYYERNIRPILAGYFPAFSDAKVKAMWAGLYSYNTVDYLPFVFRDHNLIVVGGDSGSGIMKGDSLGRITAALLRDEDTATLYGDVHYKASKLSFDKRDVEREEWVI
jgi:FAD-dependent oxidoreductase domain-containing protein 1